MTVDVLALTRIVEGIRAEAKLWPYADRQQRLAIADHAADVLERHHPIDGMGFVNECAACAIPSLDVASYWPCPEVDSVARLLEPFAPYALETT